MKKVILSILLLNAITSFSQDEKAKFSVGFFTNFGNIHVNQEDYESKNFDWNTSLKGLKAGFYVPISNGWFYNVDFDFSLTPNKGVMTSTSRDSLQQLNFKEYKTLQFSACYFLNRKVSKYLAVGGGFKVEFRKSDFNNFYLENGLLLNSKSDDTGGAFSIPINVDVYVPVGKVNLIWKNSLNVCVNKNLYLQSALCFQM